MAYPLNLKTMRSLFRNVNDIFEINVIKDSFWRSMSNEMSERYLYTILLTKTNLRPAHLSLSSSLYKKSMKEKREKLLTSTFSDQYVRTLLTDTNLMLHIGAR